MTTSTSLENRNVMVDQLADWILRHGYAADSEDAVDKAWKWIAPAWGSDSESTSLPDWTDPYDQRMKALHDKLSNAICESISDHNTVEVWTDHDLSDVMIALNESIDDYDSLQMGSYADIWGTHKGDDWRLSVSCL